MKTELLGIIIVLVIVGSFSTFALLQTNHMSEENDEECNEVCELERRRIEVGRIGDYTLIKTTWISLPVTSCGYPWHHGINEKTQQYVEEYISTVKDYDSSFWLDTDRAYHYVIKRYYEYLGIPIHDVNTYHNRTLAGEGEGCNTTVGGIWFLEISNSDLDYFLNNGYEHVEYSDVKSTESKMLGCYELFNCDITKPNFKNCIGAKKDGNTIDNICSDAEITKDDGCMKVTFPDGTGMTVCD